MTLVIHLDGIWFLFRAHFFVGVSRIHVGEFRMLLNPVIIEFLVSFVLEFLPENLIHPEPCFIATRIFDWNYTHLCIVYILFKYKDTIVCALYGYIATRYGTT